MEKSRRQEIIYDALQNLEVFKEIEAIIIEISQLDEDRLEKLIEKRKAESPDSDQGKCLK